MMTACCHDQLTLANRSHDGSHFAVALQYIFEFKIYQLQLREQWRLHSLSVFEHELNHS